MPKAMLTPIVRRQQLFGGTLPSWQGVMPFQCQLLCLLDANFDHDLELSFLNSSDALLTQADVADDRLF